MTPTDPLEKLAREIADHMGRSWGAADVRAHEGWRTLARLGLRAGLEMAAGIADELNKREFDATAFAAADAIREQAGKV